MEHQQLDQSSEDEHKWWQETLVTTKVATSDDIVREYDQALWNTIQNNSRPYFGTDRGKWIDDEDSRQTIIALRDYYHGRPADSSLRSLGSRRTLIGLSLAASLGDRLAVKKILSSTEYKEALSNLTTDQATFVLDHALFFAVEAGKEDAIPALIEQGASVNGCSYRSIGSPLQAAVNLKKGGLVRLLLMRGAKCDRYGSQGSALHIAAKNGSKRMVQLLLENGYQVDSVDGRVSKNICHETPLLTAALNGKEKMMVFLLAHGANVNQKFEDGCSYGFTALRCATKVGNINAMRLLLKHGADPLVGNYSALHDAAFYGHYEAAKLLLSHVTNIDCMKFGDMGTPISPLDAAVHVDPYLRLGPDYLNIIRLLLEKKARSRYVKDSDETDIHWWAQIRHPDLTGYRKLGVEDRKDFEAILKILIARGGNVNAQDKNGQTPLHRAVQPTWKKDPVWHLRKQWGVKENGSPHNPMPHISLLLEYGADPNIRDKNGKTPMDFAVEVKWDPEYLKKCPPW